MEIDNPKFINIPTGTPASNDIIIGQDVSNSNNTAGFTINSIVALGVSSITGTENQIIASASTGAVTLSTPQDIATTSDVIFNSQRLGGADSDGALSVKCLTASTSSSVDVIATLYSNPSGGSQDRLFEFAQTNTGTASATFGEFSIGDEFTNLGRPSAVRLSAKNNSWLLNGNFGLGTNNATEKLHVIGNGLFDGVPNASIYLYGTTSGRLTIQGDNNSTGTGARIAGVFVRANAGRESGLWLDNIDGSQRFGIISPYVGGGANTQRIQITWSGSPKMQLEHNLVGANITGLRFADSSGNLDRVLQRDATNDVQIGDIDSNSAKLRMFCSGTNQATLTSGRFVLGRDGVAGGGFNLAFVDQATGVDNGRVQLGVDTSNNVRFQSTGATTTLTIYNNQGDTLFTRFNGTSEVNALRIVGTNGNCEIEGDVSAANLADGTYTPTVSNISGTFTVNPNPTTIFRYSRIGDTVTITGNFGWTTNALGLRGFDFTVPIATTFNNVEDVTGPAYSRQQNSITNTAFANVATNRIRIEFAPTAASVVGAHSISIQYQIK